MVCAGPGQWGGKWGVQWGCGPRDFHEICAIYEWKQLERATNFHILCQILVALAHDFNADADRLEEASGIDGSHGADLDDWGDMLDEQRFGAADDLYRRQIKAKARKLFASGIADDFFDIIAIINPDAKVVLLEAFPACIRLYFSSLTLAEQGVVFALLEDVPALTICLQFIEVDPDGVFEFSYLESPFGASPRQLFPIFHHWSHTDGDIPGNQTAGFAYLVAK